MDDANFPLFPIYGNGRPPVPKNEPDPSAILCTTSNRSNTPHTPGDPGRNGNTIAGSAASKQSKRKRRDSIHDVRGVQKLSKTYQEEPSLIAAQIATVRSPSTGNNSDEGNHIKDNFFSPSNKFFYRARPRPYKRLNNANREIRLLLLNDCYCDSGKLKLGLEDKVRLCDVRSQYYAISYAAGDHRKTEIISVNDRDFNAFQTLATALRRIQDHVLPSTDEGKDYAFWADQICINQSNLKERAYQVKHMRQIYENAAQTIIYLGEDRRNGRGMRFLLKILDLISKDEDGSIIAQNRAADWVSQSVEDRQHREDWLAACEIFNTEWWRRGWVCQEALVSEDAMVLYGNTRMRIGPLSLVWDVLIRAHGNLIMRVFAKALEAPESDPLPSDEYSELVRSFNEQDHVKFILTNQKAVCGGGFLDLKSLLRHSRSCETTDERDKIYAFIGLADPAYQIEPNYEIRIIDAYTDAAACIIVKERRLDILLYSNERERRSGLPSWVPDWSSRSTRDSILSEKWFLEQSTKSPYCTVEPRVSFPEKSTISYGQVIRIEVFSLGNLSEEAKFGPDDGGGRREKCMSWMRKVGFEDFDDFESHSKEYVAGGTIQDAFISIINLFEGASDLQHLQGSLPQTRADYEAVGAQFLGISRVLDGGWSFFVNHHGYIGITPSDVKYDDELCIAWGLPIPFILRKRGERYKFLGEAYVHGLMHGEGIEMIETQVLQLRTVDLV